MMDTQHNYNFIVNSLKLLAASINDQKAYLPEFADIGWDVTSEFESAFLVLPQVVASGKLSNVAISLILTLYIRVQWCLRNLGTEDFANEQWDQVRQWAKQVLEELERPIP